MTTDVQVVLAEETGMPTVRVSRELAWDLVEYLATQRVHVTYSFESERLVVCFDHMELAGAQLVVDCWRNSRRPQAATEGNAVSHANQWLVGTTNNQRAD
jgi:hypothetical protein